MKKHEFKRVDNMTKNEDNIGWEQRPGGMIVQKRINGLGAAPSGLMITIKVSHGSYHHQIHVHAQSTFGDLKRILALETSLEPKEQRLLFRGKERENGDCLHMVGVMDMSKVVLLEDPASKERKLKERNKDSGMSKACEDIAKVRGEVDKLTKKVSALESTVHNGIKVGDKEFNVLTELFMAQLLKLDSVSAEGEAKVQRRIEVRRIQGFVEMVDILKSRNSNPFIKDSTAVSVATKWQKFECGFGSLSAPATNSSRKMTKGLGTL